MMPGQDGTQMLPGDPPPDLGGGVVVQREGEGRLVVGGQPRQRVQEYERFPFSWASLETGEEYRTPALEVRILAGDPRGATAIEFTLPEPISSYQILVWEADPNIAEHPWLRRARASVRLD
jgi:hypothetical protein